MNGTPEPEPCTCHLCQELRLLIDHDADLRRQLAITSTAVRRAAVSVDRMHGLDRPIDWTRDGRRA